MIFCWTLDLKRIIFFIAFSHLTTYNWLWIVVYIRSVVKSVFGGKVSYIIEVSSFYFLCFFCWVSDQITTNSETESRKVGNSRNWNAHLVEITWCQVVHCLVHQYAEFERDAFPCPQPVKMIAEYGVTCWWLSPPNITLAEQLSTRCSLSRVWCSLPEGCCSSLALWQSGCWLPSLQWSGWVRVGSSWCEVDACSSIRRNAAMRP